MGNRAYNNRIAKLKELEKEIKELQEIAESIKDEIKNSMNESGADEIDTGVYIIRYKDVVSNRLDSKGLKASFPNIYNEFTKETVFRRFTIN